MLVRCALVLAIVVVVAGCSYGEPSLAGSLFKCDSTHGCPADYTCTGSPGVCLLSGPGHNGVVCETGLCSVSQKCCADMSNPARCIDAAAACPGTNMYCDGREDCASGALCCDDPYAIACGRECLTTVCTTDDDCPTDTPNCCIVLLGEPPWVRHCSFEPC